MKCGHKLFSDKIWRTKVLPGWIPRRLESKCSLTQVQYKLLAASPNMIYVSGIKLVHFLISYY